jgi:predicted ATP-dependent endonuclease of OLD family
LPQRACHTIGRNAGDLMSRIRIRNFGPIRNGNTENDGWIDIKKVTVFIGNQGSGKSTVAKLISSFMWIEKAVVRDYYDDRWFGEDNKLRDFFLEYHRIENYLSTDDSNKTTIEYEGAAYSIKYEDRRLVFTPAEGSSYPLPQIMYVPAERNFIAYVRTPKELRLSSDSLQEFLTEFENAKAAIKHSTVLPINDAVLEYDRSHDILNLRGADYSIRLTEASSGFQSLVPMFIVSEYLARSVKDQAERGEAGDFESMNAEERERFREQMQQILLDKTFTVEQRRIALSVLSSKFNKTAFINIVEEPEQNLFPESQWKMLMSLLRFNNMSAGNKLIMTTHSPYLINYLTVAVKAGALYNGFTENPTKLDLIGEIVPEESMIYADDLAVYEMNEHNGRISRLESYKGMPSDENYLNQGIAEGNELFAKLLDIQQSA